jgi:hypothetical protein
LDFLLQKYPDDHYPQNAKIGGATSDVVTQALFDHQEDAWDIYEGLKRETERALPHNLLRARRQTLSPFWAYWLIRVALKSTQASLRSLQKGESPYGVHRVPDDGLSEEAMRFNEWIRPWNTPLVWNSYAMWHEALSRTKSEVVAESKTKQGPSADLQKCLETALNERSKRIAEASDAELLNNGFVRSSAKTWASREMFSFLEGTLMDNASIMSMLMVVAIRENAQQGIRGNIRQWQQYFFDQEKPLTQSPMSLSKPPWIKKHRPNMVNVAAGDEIESSTCPVKFLSAGGSLDGESSVKWDARIERFLDGPGLCAGRVKVDLSEYAGAAHVFRAFNTLRRTMGAPEMDITNASASELGWFDVVANLPFITDPGDGLILPPFGSELDGAAFGSGVNLA